MWLQVAAAVVAVLVVVSVGVALRARRLLPGSSLVNAFKFVGWTAVGLLNGGLRAHASTPNKEGKNPAAGAPAPDGDVFVLPPDGSAAAAGPVKLLSLSKPGRPLLLNFGSCS